MTIDQILQSLRPWHDTLRDLDQQYQALSALIGCDAESPLGGALHADAYTAHVAAHIGMGQDAMLSAWAWEHSFGQRPMRARLDGEPLREISTVEELAAFISAIVAD